MFRTKIRGDITLSSDHELFIAICYQKSKTHSFILVGAKDNLTKRTYILSAAGKYLDLKESNVRHAYFSALFHSVPSKLNEENSLFEKEVAEVSYKAFTITEDQYLDYLEKICACKKSPILGAYHKIDEVEDNKVLYRYNEFITVEQPKNNLNNSVEKLNVFNTCRHTAKEMLATTIPKKEQGNGISSFFLRSLPFLAKISRGRMQGDLFIFPAPPHKENLSPELYKTLSKLYHQLEQIPKKYLQNENTIKKFQEIKDLYVKLDTRKASASIDDLFNIIDDWEFKNRQLIDAKRGLSLFRHTATRKMINEIKHLHLKPKRHSV